MQDLFGRQTAYVQRLSAFQPEQIIGTDRKRLGNPNQHVDRRHDVVVFPVADALLRDIQAFAEFHLVDGRSSLMRSSNMTIPPSKISKYYYIKIDYIKID